MAARAEASSPPIAVDGPGLVGLTRDHAAEAPWTDRQVDTMQGRVAVRETRGTGLPLLLLHGHATSKDAFRRQMDGALGMRHRMVAIDLPGHGASEDAQDPDHGYTLTGYADAVVEVVESLGIDRFAVLGWSLGGHVALEICAGAPGVVGAMLVGAPAIGADPEGTLAAFKPSAFLDRPEPGPLSEAEVRDLAAWIGVTGDGALAEAIRRADGRARAAFMRDVSSLGASDGRAIVGSLPIPLAVVDGKEDRVVERSYVDGLRYAMLWEGRTHVIPGVGHAPFLDAPNLFNAILARFLEDLERRPGLAPPFGTSLAG